MEFYEICDNLIDNIDRLIVRVLLGQAKPSNSTLDGEIIEKFDTVLVRNGDSDSWKIDIFRYTDEERNYVTLCGVFKQCIRFKGKEELLNTRNTLPGYINNYYYYIETCKGYFKISKALEDDSMSCELRRISGNYFKNYHLARTVYENLVKIWCRYKH